MLQEAIKRHWGKQGEWTGVWKVQQQNHIKRKQFDKMNLEQFDKINLDVLQTNRKRNKED